MPPHCIQHGLHIERRGSGDNDRVLVRQDDAKLAECTVTAVSVTRHPELKPVALAPIRLQLIRIINLLRCGFSHPALGKQLIVVPPPAPQVQLAEFCDVFGSSVQATVALLPTGEGLPTHLSDAEWIEQTGPQVPRKRHSGFALDNARQRVRARLVIREHGARRAIRRDEEETADRLLGVELERAPESFVLMAAGHRGDVAYTHRAATHITDVPVELREVRHHGVVQAQQALSRGKTGCCRSKRLAQRVQPMWSFRRVWTPPAFRHNMTVSHEHQAMHLDVRASFKLVEERKNSGWI